MEIEQEDHTIKNKIIRKTSRNNEKTSGNDVM